MFTRQQITLALAAVVFSRAAAAQQNVATQLSLNAGSATDITGITSRAVSVSPSLTVGLTPQLALALNASGTRFDRGAWAALVGAAAVASHRLGPLALTLDSRASFTETSYDRSYLVAGVTPVLEVRWSAFTVYAGRNLKRATNWSAPRTPRTPLPGPFAPETDERITTTAVGNSAIYGVNIRAAVGGATVLAAGLREERGRVALVNQTDRAATASLQRSAVTLSVTAGTRSENDEALWVGNGMLSLALSPTTALHISGGRYAADHLSGAADGRFVNAGFSIALGGGVGGGVGGGGLLPKPAGAPALASGMTRLSIAARAASQVELAGDFTGWVLRPAVRAANGVWYLDLAIAPGRYRYAFRIDGREWRTPDGAATADDGFGGRSALLTIERATPGRNSR
jgi:hypothetical protein